jgi:hypothetical protein
LATLLAVYSLRSRAGFFSHRQRSWDSPFGAFPTRKVFGVLPPEWPHLPFHPSVLPPPWRWAGPTGPGSWGLTLSRVPGARQRVSSPTAGCSPGSFGPSRVRHRKPRSGLLPNSSLALCGLDDHSPGAPAPQSIARLSTGLFHVAHRSAPAGKGDPSRVPAPARSRAFER